MREDAPETEQSVLRVRLEMRLDRQPISGRLRSDSGAEQAFEGWLGFVVALKRLREIEPSGRRSLADQDR